ncbi:MAG: hypothetical protein JW798_06585, partial [Prolixibacteraceae bacterium]|nr:hypothetical protein [Prolixibacteraceae bacterium]
MRKFLSILTCFLLFSFALKAQEWNISSGSFNALGTISATTTVEGLTIYATDAASVTVDGNNKSVNGMDFTSRLKLGGSGTITDGAPVSRVLAFDVTGPVTVAVACMSSSSSSDRVLDMMSSASGEVLYSYTALGASISYEEYSYTGGAATLYLLSPSNGVNVYYIKVEAAAVTANDNEIVKGGDMEDPSVWNFYYNSADAHNVDGTIEFGYTADKPSAGEGGCYRVSTYGQSATFLWQKIKLEAGHTYHWDGAFKNALESAPSTWLEFGIMKEQPTGGEIATGEFSYVFNLNTWMGADTLNVDTTFGEYFPFSGANSNTFKIPESETDREWFIVIKTGCWG